MSIKQSELRLPRWMKVPLPKGANYSRVKNLIKDNGLNTICVSGNCPNKGECWNAGTATFMILGSKCTRNCRFCQVTSLKPNPVDYNEPQRLAETIRTLDLKHAVITSVSRDDLEDGGASIWAETIRQVRKLSPNTTLEVLIPDFKGVHEHLQMVIDAKPNVISHNIETVERLTPKVRSMFTYKGSLDALKYIAESGITTKSGMMLGLSETKDEVLQAMKDLREVGVKVVTIGQYLPPSEKHAQLVEYVKPEMFELYKEEGLKMGFKVVESGALVRSSYHAERHVL
ncbi:lipoyl synthase [Bacteroidales bacterium]|nr:lipoyl synthase [Bacteroidales bacterium]